MATAAGRLLEMFVGAALLAFFCILLGKATPLWNAMQACVGVFGLGLTWLLAGLALLVSAVVQLVLGLLMFALDAVQLVLQLLQQVIMALMGVLVGGQQLQHIQWHNATAV